MNEEILKCDKVLAYVGIFSFLAIVAGLIFISYKLAIIPYEKSYDRPSFHFPVWFVSGIVCPLLLIGVAVNIKNLIQIKMAPKLYINNNYVDKKTEENK